MVAAVLSLGGPRCVHLRTRLCVSRLFFLLEKVSIAPRILINEWVWLESLGWLSAILCAVWWIETQWNLIQVHSLASVCFVNGYQQHEPANIHVHIAKADL